MKLNHKISPCLWFNSEAEEAAKFYTGIFPDSKVGDISRYAEDSKESGKSAGSVLLVEFTVNGQPFTALNGGPIFKFTEAISFQIYVDDQKELDYYWDKLGAGGDPKSHVCGWLKDQYGLSWQIVPAEAVEWWKKPDERSKRAFQAMMKMGKLDIAALKKAYNGA
jgi:predicted 3-demethylubiquinone-9 3-methyltransferase (glyoxalase superfamily)